MFHSKRYLLWSSFVLIVAMLSSCVSLFGNSEAIEETPQEDVVMAMKVKAALIETSELSAAAIEVDASSGRIRLSGFVETASQRQLAGNVAHQVRGVKGVINEIEIK